MNLKQTLDSLPINIKPDLEDPKVCLGLSIMAIEWLGLPLLGAFFVLYAAYYTMTVQICKRRTKLERDT